MSTQKIISICIPTYNRGNCIGQNLDSIISQFSDPEVRENIEIIVSDNASTDNTQSVMEEYAKKFDNIFYYRNSENIGFDRNVLNVIDKATGIFCMPIGDDDAFFPGSISALLQEVKKSPQCPYFMLNYWGYDHELNQPVMAAPAYALTEDETYNTLGDFVRSIKKYSEIVGFFGGMSTQFFRRADWANFPDKEKYIGTQCIHLFTILSVFRDSPFMRLAMPMVKTRNDNIRWDTFPGYGTNAKRIKITIDSLLWIRDKYNLPISTWSVNMYFTCRGYWSTFKTHIKVLLHKLGLRK
jgi:abequosyltransferase